MAAQYAGGDRMKGIAFIVGAVLLLGLAHASVLAQVQHVTVGVEGMY